MFNARNCPLKNFDFRECLFSLVSEKLFSLVSEKLFSWVSEQLDHVFQTLWQALFNIQYFEISFRSTFSLFFGLLGILLVKLAIFFP